MKGLLITSFALGVFSCLTSCSCGIFRDEFVPMKRLRPLTDQAVRQVAMTNGFSERSAEHGSSRFKNNDIDILYDHSSQLVVVRSSLCPLFSMPLDSADWQTRCKAMSVKIAGDFNKAGIPVCNLSAEEQIKRNQGEQVVTPNGP